MAFTEKSAVAELIAGKTVEVKGHGNSMTPILQNGEVVTVEPIADKSKIKKGDIVLAKVKGNVYLHKVTAVKPDSLQIGNNHGHINGWASHDKVFGKLRPRSSMD